MNGQNTYFQSIWEEFIPVSVRVFASGKNNVAKNQEKIYFPKNRELESRPIMGIKAVCFDDSKRYVSNNVVYTPLSLDVHSRYVITLVSTEKDSKGESIILLDRYPLAQLCDITRRGRMFTIGGRYFDVSKSYIQPTENMTGSPGTFFLQFYPEI